MKVAKASGIIQGKRQVHLTFYFDNVPDEQIEEEIKHLLPPEFFQLQVFNIEHYGPDGLLIEDKS